MLKNNIVVSSPLPEIKPNLLDFENLYRIIAKYSYIKAEPLHEILSITRNNYYEFLTKISIPTVKNRMLLEQLNLLKEKNFFINKFDLTKLTAILKDITNKGEQLKFQFLENDKQDFNDLLHNINHEAQTSQPIFKTFPDEIKTGISFQEQSSIQYGVEHLTSSPSITLNNKGVKHCEKKEWPQAIKFFEEALIAEKEMAVESKNKPDDSLLSLYKRNSAFALSSLGYDFIKNRSFKEAADCFNKAIAITLEIPLSFQEKNHKAMLSSFYRSLADVLDTLAMDYFFSPDLQKSFDYHQASLSTHEKIPAELFTEIDEKIKALYQSNFAYVSFELANKYYDENKIAEAIPKYQKTINLLSLIKEEFRTSFELELLAHAQHDLLIAKITLSPFITSGLFSRKNEELPDAEMHPNSKKKETTKKS